MHDALPKDYFSDLIEMVNYYHMIKRREQREKERKEFKEEQRRLQEQDKIERDELLRRKLEEEQKIREQHTEETKIKKDDKDIKNVNEGEEFISSLTYDHSIEWRSGRGTRHFFKDNEGNIYVIFDRYTRDSEGHYVPKFNFNEGESYTIKGKKGEFNTRFRPHSTKIDRPKIIEEDHTTSPTEDTGITQQDTTTEPSPPFETPTAPINIEEIEKEKEEKLDKILKINNYAKNVIETGRTRTGKPMTPAELIPLYLKQIEKTIGQTEGELSKEWHPTLSKNWAANGKEGLISGMNLIYKILKNTL